MIFFKDKIEIKVFVLRSKEKFCKILGAKLE